MLKVNSNLTNQENRVDIGREDYREKEKNKVSDLSKGGHKFREER